MQILQQFKRRQPWPGSSSLYSDVNFFCRRYCSCFRTDFLLTQTVTQMRKRTESIGKNAGSERSGKSGRERDKRSRNGLTNSATAAHNPEVVGSNPSPATTKKHSPPLGGLCFFAVMGKNPARCSSGYETDGRSSLGKAGPRRRWREQQPRFFRSRAIGGPRRSSPAREWQMRQGGAKQ